MQGDIRGVEMISRRSFLKGTVATAAGLILSPWLVHAERYIEGERLPFCDPLKSHQDTIYAVNCNDDGEYQLYWGRVH
ncbi:MAG TPA: twin-arginine translocation signal domain-containing protein [Methylococcaceae bacterium]|nr:twin-arginine translocation signal domain-containing protein [Methylococcaceae bacterium]HIN68040.1 twin-arginine translocation signal domain-containing protein [Methylococcales bacterium]